MSGPILAGVSPETLNSFFALALGFAVAGMCASGYRLAWQHFPSFQMLEVGPLGTRFAAIPVLMFSAPFIIMRNTLRGVQVERRRFEFVMLATIIAGFWSLMSGTFFVMTLRAAGLIA